MGNGLLQRDDNGVPVLGAWSDSAGKVYPLHIKSLVVGADGNTYAQLDIQTTNFIGGAAASTANPYPSADQINLWIDAGQAFFVSTDLLSAAAANQAFMLTNPTGSGKVFEVYRADTFNSNANSTVQVRIANPSLAAFATDITSFIGNMNQASATASLGHASYSVTTTSPPAASSSSLPFFAGNTALNGMAEFLQNNARIILNAGESLVIYLGNTAAGKIGANFWWVER